MSHLDALDESEAALELRPQPEYASVFGPCRYCILSPDVTYLRNKLDVEQASQPSYPYLHLRMEDVWVWDKNRPARIIPRAEVFTSGDVTIEELNSGEGSQLTAAALAERIGEQLHTEDDD